MFWHNRIGKRSSHDGRFFLGGDKMEDYPDFTTSTGYGLVDGLCGVNCR